MNHVKELLKKTDTPSFVRYHGTTTYLVIFFFFSLILQETFVLDFFVENSKIRTQQ